MKNLSKEIWVHEDELRLAGTPLRLRMTIVKLSDGKLWVHSPTAISDSLTQEVSTLGEVGYIVGPNNAHNLYLMEWKAAFPKAELVIAPGIRKKLKLIGANTTMDAQFENCWAEDLDRVYMPGVSFFDESVFLHKKSRSLIVTDYIQNFEGDAKTFLQKYVFGALGFKGICVAPPLKLGLMHKDKAGFKQSVEQINSWEFDRIIVTHGDIIETNAMEIVRDLSKRFR